MPYSDHSIRPSSPNRVRPRDFFIFSQRFMIFGMYVHYHDMMCRVPVLPLYDLDLWPQVQLLIMEEYIRVRPRIFFIFSHRFMTNSIFTWHTGGALMRWLPSQWYLVVSFVISKKHWGAKLFSLCISCYSIVESKLSQPLVSS
jgi:hypothetical protein